MKRKSKLLFIVMVALMIFAGIEVMAQTQYCPSTCTAGPYTITLTGVFLSDCKDASGNVVPCYDYSYTITPPLSSTNQAVALIPVCCENPIITYPMCTATYPNNCSPDAKNGDFGDSPSKIYLPGDGDPTSKFGLGIGMVYAVRSEPHEQPNPHIHSSSQIVGPITMQIKSGKDLFYCENIIGPRCPDCGKPGQVPAVTKKNIVIEGMYVSLTIDSSKCVQQLSLCDNNFLNCIPQEAVYMTATSYDALGNPDGRIANTSIREISDIDGNQRCAWGRIWMADSPGCTSIPSGGGRYFLVGDTCKCTSSTQCYPPKTCVSGLCK